MAYEEGNNTVMPVVPMGGNNGGFGNFGGDGWWILILFFLLSGNNGWGNNGFGGMNGLYPWMNNSQNINDGFRDQFMNTQLTALQTGLNDVQTALMQQNFGLQSALQNCCCENRASIADLKYGLATEACANRTALNEGIRDVLTATQAQNQRILDQLCADKIDAKNEKIADLQRQLTMAQLAASQGAQTAAIIANNEAQTTALEQYLAPVPRPAYVVQNPNCCAQNAGCGCGNF